MNVGKLNVTITGDLTELAKTLKNLETYAKTSGNAFEKEFSQNIKQSTDNASKSIDNMGEKIKSTGDSISQSFARSGTMLNALTGNISESNKYWAQYVNQQEKMLSKSAEVEKAINSVKDAEAELAQYNQLQIGANREKLNTSDKLESAHKKLYEAEAKESIEVKKLNDLYAKASAEQLKMARTAETAGNAAKVAKSSFGSFFNEIEQRAKSAEQKLEGVRDGIGRIQSAGGSLSMYITAPLTAFAGYIGYTASQTIEAENLIRESFKDMGGAAQDWADEVHDATGQVTFGLRKNASMFYNMFEAMEMGKVKSFEYATGLTQLAGDMASFYNISTADAIQKLSAGITGQTEPLRRLGIILTENKVKQEALRIGLIKQGQELSEQGKVMARYSLIMRSTEAAQGDLARTVSDPENKFRNGTERFQDAARTLGTALEPALHLAADAFYALSDGALYLSKQFAILPDWLKMIIVGAATLTATLGPLLLIIGGVAQAIVSLSGAAAIAGPALGIVTTAFKSMGVAAAGALGPIGLLVAALGVAALAWKSYHDARLGKDVQGLEAGAEVKRNDAGDYYVKKQVEKSITDDYGEEIKYKSWDWVKEDNQDTIKALDAKNGKSEDYKKKIADLEKLLGEQGSNAIAHKSGGGGSGSSNSVYEEAKADYQYYKEVIAGEKTTAAERLELFEKMVGGKAKSAKELKDYEMNLIKLKLEAEKEALEIESAMIEKEYNERKINDAERARREIAVIDAKISKEKEGSLKRIQLEAERAAMQDKENQRQISEVDNKNRRIIEIEEARMSVVDEMIRHEVAMENISNQEAILARAELNRQKYEIDLNAIEERLELMRLANLTETEEYRDMLAKKELLQMGFAKEEIRSMNEMAEANTKWILDLKNRFSDSLVDFVDGSIDSIKSLGKALKKELMSDAFRMLLGGQAKDGGILSGLLGDGKKKGGKNKDLLGSLFSDVFGKNKKGGKNKDLFGGLLGDVFGGNKKGGKKGDSSGGSLGQKKDDNSLGELMGGFSQLNTVLGGTIGLSEEQNSLLGIGNMLFQTENILSQLFGTVTKPTESAATAAATGALSSLAAAAAAAAIALKSMSFGGGIFGEQGGIMPSAAGGMITGSSGYGARKNIPAILHPKEMVLPKHISEMIIDLASQHKIAGGFNATPAVNGGNIYINVNNPVIKNDMDIKTIANKLGTQLKNRVRGGR